MYKLKSIDIGSVIIYSFLMYLILGLIIFLLLGLLVSAISTFLPDTSDFDSTILPFFGGVFILLIPIFYAVLGSVVNAVIVLLYNLISKKFGGIKIELENLDQIESEQ